MVRVRPVPDKATGRSSDWWSANYRAAGALQAQLGPQAHLGPQVQGWQVHCLLEH